MRHVGFLLIGCGLFASLLVPLIRARIRVHSVYGWVLLSAATGLVIRPFYLWMAVEPRLAEELFWRGVALDALVAPAAALGVALLLFGFVYLAVREGTAVVPARHWQTDQEKSLRLVAGAVSLVGLGAAFVYVQQTGGFDPAALSAKRVIANQENLREGLASVGPALAVGRAGLLASIVSYHLRVSRNLRPRLAIVFICANMLLPIYASDRTGVLLVLLQIAALRQFRFGRIRLRTVATWGLLLVLLLQLLSGLRGAARSDSTLAVDGPTEIVETLLLNRSFFDLSKNLHVIRSTGTLIEQQYGSTIVATAVAPIPRSVWPDKPVISPGPEIGQNIYNTGVAGVPPGVFAEGYWNFRLLGLATFAGCFGAICGRLDASARDEASPFSQAIFVLVFLPIGYNAVASSVSSVLLDLMRDGLTLGAIWTMHRLLVGSVMVGPAPPAGNEQVVDSVTGQ